MHNSRSTVHSRKAAIAAVPHGLSWNTAVQAVALVAAFVFVSAMVFGAI